MQKTILIRVAAAILLAMLALPLAAVGSFTPVIDGIKEAGWGSTPDATSASYRSIGGAATYHSQNACQDVYVTDDPDNLYIGYYYNGDAWDDGEGASARIMFGFLTNTSGTSGGDSDPWESTTKFGSANKPDFFLRQWTEYPHDERMEFGGPLGYSAISTKGVAEFLRWNGTAWIGTGVSINHYERLTLSGAANNWGEIAIPLSVLGVKTGEPIRMFLYYRPNPGRPGYSDSTPFDPNASVEALQSGPSYALNTNFSYTIQSDNVAPVLSSITPDHTATGQQRSVNLGFTVTDNKNFNNTGISVIIEGNDAIVNGVFQAGYGGSITGNGTQTHTVTINPDSDFAYNQRVNVTVYVTDTAGNQVEKTYYFDIKPDTTAPALSALSPAPLSTGAALSVPIQFSIADDDQVSQNSINVTINGSLALTNGAFQSGFNGSSSQIVPSGSGYSVVVDPESDFGFGQTVTVVLRGRDATGNTVTTNYSFSTTQDNIAPTISSRNPADGANNITRNAVIAFQLADNIGVLSNRISASVGGTNAIVNGAFQSGYSGSITANGTGWDVSINPAADFSFSAVIPVSITARDAQDNQLSDSWSFTVKADDVLPSISSVSPASGAAGVTKNSDITFVATDADSGIDITSVNVSVNGVAAVSSGSGQSGFVFSYTATNNGYCLKVNPDTDFQYDQTMTVTASFEDASVNRNRYTTTWSFTVKSDDVPPTIGSLNPAAGQTGVNTNAMVSLQLADDSAVENASVYVRINGLTAITNGTFVAPFNGPLSQMSGSGSVSLTIDNTGLWAYRSTNTVRVYVRDTSGNLLQTNYSFTVKADDVAPVLSALSPGNGSSSVANNTTIEFDVSDNSAVDQSTIVILMQTNTTQYRVVYTNGAFLPGYTGSVTANAGNGYRVSFKPGAQFAFGTTVNLRLSAKDQEGNSVGIDPWTFTIQTGDAVPPAISKLSPYNGQSGVEPNTSIYLETADNVHVSRDSINVHVVFPAIDGGGTKVAVTNGAFTPEFQGPASSIVSNAYGGYDIRIDYSATALFSFTNSYTVYASIRDTSINSNEASSAWSFTIRPPDTTPPELVSFNPGDGTEDVPVSTSISLMTRDNYGVSLNTIRVELNGTAIFTNGVFAPEFQGPGSSITANADHGYNITIDPVGDFTFGQTLNFRITMQDTSLNSTVHNVSFRVLELKPARPLTNIMDPRSGNRNIRIKINRTGYAGVAVYNLRGEKVWTLAERFYNAGDVIEWAGVLRDSGRVVGSGYYFVRITGSDINTTVRVLVVR